MLDRFGLDAAVRRWRAGSTAGWWSWPTAEQLAPLPLRRHPLIPMKQSAGVSRRSAVRERYFDTAGLLEQVFLAAKLSLFPRYRISFGTKADGVFEMDRAASATTAAGKPAALQQLIWLHSSLPQGRQFDLGGKVVGIQADRGLKLPPSRGRVALAQMPKP